MRYIILLVLCAWTGIALAIDYHAKDSLLLQLKQTTIAAEQMILYAERQKNIVWIQHIIIWN